MNNSPNQLLSCQLSFTGHSSTEAVSPLETPFSRPSLMNPRPAIRPECRWGDDVEGRGVRVGAVLWGAHDALEQEAGDVHRPRSRDLRRWIGNHRPAEVRSNASVSRRSYSLLPTLTSQTYLTLPISSSPRRCLLFVVSRCCAEPQEGIYGPHELPSPP